MIEIRDDSVVLDVQENDHTLIDGLDFRHEDRQAWVAGLKKRIFTAKTISSVGRAATAANSNDNNNSSPSIYRIPACIREVNPTAYEPKVISLGPYNYRKSDLQAMNGLKWCYLRRFLLRNKKQDLVNYIALVEELESQVRGAYNGLEPSFHGKDFILMMLLDCCFVLEFLLLNYVNDDKEEEEEEGGDEEEEEEEPGGDEEEEEEEEEDPNKNFGWAMPFLARDMLLLENQLPFFLLEKLLELNSPHRTPPLPKIVCNIFWGLMPGKIHSRPYNMSYVNVPIHHILHLMYGCTIPRSVMEDYRKVPSLAFFSCLFKMFSRWARIFRRRVQSNHPDRVDPKEPTRMWFPSAMKLREVGMVFKRKRDHECFLDITFAGGVMEIPPLQIDAFFDPNLCNLVAFEQLYKSNYEVLYLSSYVHMMNMMVNTATDAQMLKREGILTSMDSDDGIVNIFHNLRKSIEVDQYGYLYRIFQDILIHCNKRTSRWKDALNQNWEIISVAAATFLFVLSIIQTVLAFFSYLRPSSPN